MKRLKLKPKPRKPDPALSVSDRDLPPTHFESYFGLVRAVRILLNDAESEMRRIIADPWIPTWAKEERIWRVSAGFAIKIARRAEAPARERIEDGKPFGTPGRARHNGPRDRDEPTRNLRL